MTTRRFPWQHVASHDNTSLPMTTRRFPWQHVASHDNTSLSMTTRRFPWQHIASHDNTSLLMTTHRFSWQHVASHNKTSLPMTTHRFSWQHVAFHDNTSLPMTTRRFPWQHVASHDNMFRPYQLSKWHIHKLLYWTLIITRYIHQLIQAVTRLIVPYFVSEVTAYFDPASEMTVNSALYWAGMWTNTMIMNLQLLLRVLSHNIT